MTTQEVAKRLEHTAELVGMDVKRERKAFDIHSTIKTEEAWSVWLERAVIGACRLI
jgi:hypothetical protein